MYDVILSQVNGIVTADSREVAEHFEKNHRDILRAIDDLMEGMRRIAHTPCNQGVPKSGETPLFVESFYVNSQNGQTYRKYDMTQDGFCLLVMGFTGDKALKWKAAYIRAFNTMAQRVAQPATIAEQLLGHAQFLVEAEKRLNGLEANQLQLTSQVEHIARAILPIGDDWQDEMERRIKGVCHEFDLSYEYEHRMLYATLESRGYNLSSRKANLQRRLAAEGATKTRQDAVTKISVIASDPIMRTVFERIVEVWIVERSRTGVSA